MAALKTLDSIGNVSSKQVLVRVDLNVPVVNGQVTDATRIERVLPTITELADKRAKVILLSHFGRPKEGSDEALSLAPIAVVMAKIICRPVRFATDCIGEKAAAAVGAMKDGDILLLENTRFHKAEENNDQAFVEQLAANGDIFVNDAFSVANRAHASTEGLSRKLPSYAGRTMQAEIEALEKSLGNPVRPVVVIVGGAKVSTKINLLMNLVKKVDALVIGGGMANTFLAARGTNVGKSLCEHDFALTAKQIMIEAAQLGCAIVLPSDGVVVREFKAGVANEVVTIDAVPADAIILDVGPKTVASFKDWIDRASTLVWNGPLGAFEIDPFGKATISTIQHAAARTKAGKLVSIAGGGDTIAALNHTGVADDFTYFSTAGGAFLEWIEGKELPGVAMLKA